MLNGCHRSVKLELNILLLLLQDAEKAAKRLTDEAFSRGSNDNITCVVLRFSFK